MLEVFWDNLFKITKKDEDIRLIKNCPLFSQLSPYEIAFIKTLFHKRNYVAGEIIFKPLAGMGLYMILKGKVRRRVIKNPLITMRDVIRSPQTKRKKPNRKRLSLLIFLLFFSKEIIFPNELGGFSVLLFVVF